MEKSEDFQEHYDKIEKTFLLSEHRFFIGRCKGRGLIVSPDVESFDAFFAHAKKQGYLLGQKVAISNDKGKEQNSVSLNELVFRFTPTIGKKVEENGKLIWKQVPNPKGITGFGLDLNLLGWSKLLRLRLDELQNALRSKSVEQIYAERFPPTRYVSFDGERTTVNKALESSGCDKRTFWRAIDEIAEYQKKDRRDLEERVYQSVFDSILKKSRPRIAQLKQHGITTYKSLWWIHISAEDKKTIEQLANDANKTPSEWLHDVVQSYSYS